MVVGAGFSGVAAAAALDWEGVEFLVLERADDVGGIWSHGSVSDPDRVGPAIRRLVHERGLLDRFRFGQHVLDATWDGARRQWTVRTRNLEVTADLLVDASGRPADTTSPGDLPCYVRLGASGRGRLNLSTSAYRRMVRQHLALAC